MQFSPAEHSLRWLSLSLLLFVGCWGTESTQPAKPLPTPPAKPSTSPGDTTEPSTESAEAEEKPPFEIEAMVPEREYKIIRLKMPHNHGGLHSVAWAPDSSWLAGGTRTASMSFQGVTRSAGGEVLVWNMSDQNLRTLGSHGATVEQLLATPDGKLLISVSRANKTIKFWNMPEGELAEELTFPGGHWPRSTWPLVQLSLDGSLLAVVTYQKIEHEGNSYPYGNDLLIWETATREQLLHWKSTEIDAYALATDPFRLAAVVRKKRADDPRRSDKYLTVWHAPEQESLQRKKLERNSSLITILPDEGVAVSKEQPRLDKLLARYDLTTLERTGAETIASGKAIPAGADFFVSATNPGKAEYCEWGKAGVINLATGQYELRLQLKPSAGTFTNRFSPDLKYFVPAYTIENLFVVQFKHE